MPMPNTTVDSSNALPLPRRGRTGWYSLTCRRRHLKCDEEKPSCGRCRRTARECIPDNLLTFRSSQKVAARGQLKDNKGLSSSSSSSSSNVGPLGNVEHDTVFSKDHYWLETPAKLSFVDETSIVTAEYEHHHHLARSQSATTESTTSTVASQNRLRSLSTASPLLPDEPISASADVHGGGAIASTTTTSKPSFNAPEEPFTLSAAPRRHSTVSPEATIFDRSVPVGAAAAAAAASTGGPSDYLPLISSPASASGGAIAPIPLSDPVNIPDPADAASHVSPSEPYSPEALHRKVGLLLYTSRMLLPFTVPQEALLFHHYMEALAALLDITDIQRHFAVDVPELALSCPVLLYAMMAFSARHLSRTSDFDSAVADHYHHECVSLMIPMLDRKDLVADETLFAAAVILRAFEETNESKMGAEPERHLTGTSVFANAQLEFRTWGGLGHAAFWVFVRQDIYMSLLSQRPLKVNLAGWEERLSFDLGFNETNDCTWANRMTWIVAEIVSFCFGDQLNYAKWEAARSKTERWNLCRPKSFDPVLYFDRDEAAGRYFPDIRLGHPWHTTGVQYYYIAKLFLAIYNPHVPRMGLGYQRHRRSISGEVLRNAEAVVGIALSTSLVAARLTACKAIIACGPWFHERPRAEQEQLLQLLKRTEMESALPTESLIQGLIEEWGWDVAPG